MGMTFYGKKLTLEWLPKNFGRKPVNPAAPVKQQ